MNNAEWSKLVKYADSVDELKKIHAKYSEEMGRNVDRRKKLEASIDEMQKEMDTLNYEIGGYMDGFNLCNYIEQRIGEIVIKG